ncbi:MBL fold metallo-hydrolase [Neptunitalea lumnitzerae]|uniref:MBL fold metallo-hydrolase n=1 Tax=Neptunitalea lumnitzerae TaxID=2965509 RepID=A0ABQ5ME73_9FLAO|nr:MBL fold metallo-hydrolase [Neptunitalea sp. Y10]GLB47647.1 MBL fold metallo-hydrolase [Neptunitalea sp. Y10]
MRKSRNAKVHPPIIENGKFLNIEETPQLAKEASYGKVLKKNFKKPKDAFPSKELPYVTTNLKNLTAPKPVFVWFGHSSYLLSCKGFNLLVDPVFSGSASPFSFMIKAYEGADYYKAEDMPNIDVLLQTHNHYDHLDKDTIISLSGQTMDFVVSKNVGADLKKWDVPAKSITELEWGEEVVISNDLKITATPARHFSGRGLKRDTSLWSSFVVEFFGMKIFVGGDSGYGNHFKEIGEAFGPFDIALLECGQYDDFWPYIHMKPEETLQAAEDIKAAKLIPVHWGKFTLANHPWNESISRITSAAENSNIQLITPKIGEIVDLSGAKVFENWWENY